MLRFSGPGRPVSEPAAVRRFRPACGSHTRPHLLAERGG
jgi:hypothetical protein